MRDNTKGGALTEVTFYILLSLYMPKHGYEMCIRDRRQRASAAGRLRGFYEKQ